jgi:hypothetical protein
MMSQNEAKYKATGRTLSKGVELGAKAFHRPDRIREQESKDWTAKEIKGRGRMVSLVLVLKHKYAMGKWGTSSK